MIIDTHSHIYGPEYDDDRDDVIARARQTGVGKVILANVNADTIAPMHRCQDMYPDFTATAIGLHPTDVDGNYKQQLSVIEQSIDPARHIAIGEVGLDLYWDKTYYREQCEALTTQIEWALEYNLPLIMHVRKAYAETFELLKQFRGRDITGVMHCFSGGIEEAKKAMELGFHIGIGGVITYKNSQLADIVEQIGLDRLLLETDAPYLSPVPYRGKRNEPSYLTHVIDKIASVLQLNAQTIENKTTENAKQLFRKLQF